MPAIGIHQLHTRDIGIAVADVDHVAERHAQRFRREVIVHGGIIDVQHALLDAEQELCLAGVVDHLSRPDRDALFVIEKRARVDLFKGACLGDGSTLDHFFQSGCHERAGSTSFAERFVRLDPPLFLPSQS